MSKDVTEHAVIAVFDSSAQAHQAANDLLDWQKTNPLINLGPIGVLTRNAKGEIKTKSYGARNTARGARIGVGIGALAAVLSGGLTLIPTAIGGAVVGAAAGSLSHKGLRLTELQTEKLNSDLEHGCAAILVGCDESEVRLVNDYLSLEGGRVSSFQVNVEAVASTAAQHSSK